MISVRATDDVGTYELLRLLGQGGYCAVYEARDRRTEERVALKRLTRVGPASLSNFKREFRSVQGVHHSNLVDLRELFEFDGSNFIAMELVDGMNLLEYVRGDGGHLGFNEERLRDAFAQLCEGLMALHAAGIVHRDVKPRNVLVSQKGRVVLLDFGLVHEKADATMSDVAGQGSAEYMAPEQISDPHPGPAADFYGLGVCLYEALTGSKPFNGAPMVIIAAKQRESAMPPSALVSGLPRDLCSLCERLLDRDPRNRGTAADILRVFGGSAKRKSPESRTTNEFSGRERELSTLERQYDRSRQGGLHVVLVEGESGIGKSTLVSEMLRRVRQHDPEVMVLRSRCYENEQLAYKAFDGALETLARELSALEPSVCQSLLPDTAAVLPRLFGAFAAVSTIAQSPFEQVPADPSARRMFGFSALAALLANVSKHRPLVFEIDDLQWADAESFRLLQVIAEQDAEARILIVATLRPKAELSDEVAAALSNIASRLQACTIELAGLAEPDARALAIGLLGGRGNAVTLEAILRESKGHPLFLSELVRHTESQALAASERLTLDGALRARVERLTAAALDLVTAVAVAGRPYRTPLFASMLGQDTESVHALATDLLAAKLLRRRGADEISCFHDRIRRVVTARLGSEELTNWHRRCADALSAEPAADPAELARHRDAGGDVAAAIDAYVRAGQERLSSLAFARAEQLFRRGLELCTTGSAPVTTRTALHVGCGHAMARGGRSAEAAEEYLAAAQHTEGDDRIRLRILAVQHLLQGAQVERGMSAARQLLKDVGLSMPSSPSGALACVMWDRVCLAISGLDVEERKEEIGPRARMQLDALWGLALPVAWLEPLTSAAMSTRHLRKARALGDPAHVARALGEEAFARTIQRTDDPVAEQLLLRARALCERIGDPTLDVGIAFREGAVAYFRWNLPLARERLEHAQRIGTERCPDHPWLMTNVRSTLASTLTSMGEYAQLKASCSAWLREAHDRSDRFALTMLEGVSFGFFRHLMDAEPDEAASALASALTPWPREPFSFAHFGEMMGTFYIERYRGGDAGYRWFERERARLAKAFILRSGHGKALMHTYLAYAALGACQGLQGERAAELLYRARAAVRTIHQVCYPLATLNAAFLEAQIAAIDGAQDRALDGARRVQAEAAERSYLSLAWPAQYFAGVLEGGDGGARERKSALASYARHGWKQPERAATLMCPALDVLGARQ